MNVIGEIGHSFWFISPQIIFDKYAQDKEEFTREMFNVNARVTEVNAYFRALEEILRKTTDAVRDQEWNIKDLQREVLGD